MSTPLLGGRVKRRQPSKAQTRRSRSRGQARPAPAAMAHLDDDGAMAEFIDESKFETDASDAVREGRRGLTDDESNAGSLADGDNANPSAASASGAGGMSRSQMRWTARVVHQLARAFYKSPFALPNTVAGLADIKGLCEEGAFETVEEFAKEVRSVLSRWATGKQTIDADQWTKQNVMADARKAMETFEQLMSDEPARAGGAGAGSARGSRDASEHRMSEPLESGGPKNTKGKRKPSTTHHADLPDPQEAKDRSWSASKASKSLARQQAEDDDSDDLDDPSEAISHEDGDEDEKSNGDTPSDLGGDVLESSDDEEDDGSSDEFQLRQRPVRSRKPPTEIPFSHASGPVIGFLNTTEGSLHRRFAAHILNELNKRKHLAFSVWFQDPVDLTLVPDYLSVVSDPMDISLMRRKWTQGAYDKSINLFESDMLLLLKNCYAYNGDRSEVALAGKRLEALFEEQMKRKQDFFEDPNAPEFASTASDPRNNRPKTKYTKVISAVPSRPSPSANRFDWDTVVKACEQCGTKSSPEWRRVVVDDDKTDGQEVVKMLCNACGLRIVRARRKAAQTARKGKAASGHISASQLVPTSAYQAAASAAATAASTLRESTPAGPPPERKPKKPRLSPPPMPIEELGDRKAKKAAVAAVAAGPNRTIIHPPPPQTRREKSAHHAHEDSGGEAENQRPFATRVMSSFPRTDERPRKRVNLAPSRASEEGDGRTPRVPMIVVRGGDGLAPSGPGKKRKFDHGDESMDGLEITPETELSHHSGSSLEYAELSQRVRELEKQNLQLARERAEARRGLEEKTRSSNAFRDEVMILGSQLAEKTLQLDELKRQIKGGTDPAVVSRNADELAAKLAVVAELTLQRQMEEKLFDEFESKYRTELASLTEQVAKLEETNRELARQAGENKVLLHEAVSSVDQYRKELELLTVDPAVGGAAGAASKLIEMLRKERWEANSEAETLRAALKDATQEVEEWRRKYRTRTEPLAADALAALPAEYHAIVDQQHDGILSEWRETKKQLEVAEADRDRAKSLLRAKMDENEALRRQLRELETEKGSLEVEVVRTSGKLDTVRSIMSSVKRDSLGGGVEGDGHEEGLSAGQQKSAETLAGGGVAADLDELMVDS
ncbi:hypothetical protein DFJ74DRAFT_515234 [Hyaloraphidium curvatum]|nr:hypothetical protein DFJ74DRAFT_515234 [Hyaloraphidium curvatum]